MEHRRRNFQSVKSEFRDKGKAIRGYRNLISLIENNEAKQIDTLLRFHDPKQVYGEELIRRFEIDALLEYYCLLLVAIFSGYIPGRLDEDTTNEIITILDYPAVKPYYEERYKYQLVSYVLQFAKEGREFEQEGNSLTISAFNEFVALNRILKRDEDLERFLGMLDYVWYNRNTLDDVNHILGSYDKLVDTFTAKNKSEAEKGVWGFVKFTVLLGQLKELLISTNQYPLLQSSIWTFHGYYFERMNADMKALFSDAFSNLERTFTNPEIYKSLIISLFNNEMPDDISEDTLKDFTRDAVDQSREDVDFILDKKWGAALQDYFKHGFSATDITMGVPVTA